LGWGAAKGETWAYRDYSSAGNAKKRSGKHMKILIVLNFNSIYIWS